MSSTMVRFLSLFLVFLHFYVVVVVNGVRIDDDDNKHKIVNVSKLEMFVDRLPEMPKIKGYSIKDGVHVAGNLTIGMYMKYWKFHRDLPHTRVFAFGTCKRSATIPGPTIESLRGVPTYVTWANHLPTHHILPWDPTIPTANVNSGVPTVVHLHGIVAPPPSDGHSLAWYTSAYRQVGPTFSSPGPTFYPNAQLPGNLWYHDHAVGLTRVNLLAGLLGAYVIRSPELESPLNLPSGTGGDFDRNLVIFDRSFTADGSIYMPAVGNNPDIHPEWRPEYFGTVTVVNGKAWPYLAVRRRSYRFRILNASNARYYNLSLSNDLPFVVVGSDNNYLPVPISVAGGLVLAPSEIVDVVVDFTASKTTSVTLCNSAPYPFPAGDSPGKFAGKVMKFLVKGKRREGGGLGLPEKLLTFPAPAIAAGDPPAARRYVTMYEFENPVNGEPVKLMLNFRPFGAPVTETVVAGSTEEWVVVNLTEDDHPLHVHLAAVAAVEEKGVWGLEEFKECVRGSENVEACGVGEHVARGEAVETPAHEKGWKSVVKVKPGHASRLVVRFRPLDGEEYGFDPTGEPGYVYHCHILDHEDNEMMRPLKIVH